MKDLYLDELRFCLDLWERQGYCQFGGYTNCLECAVPYILWKFHTGEALHGDMKRLSFDDWKEKIINKK